jgi:Domain of unknown function (DUF1707)
MTTSDPPVPDEPGSERAEPVQDPPLSGAQLLSARLAAERARGNSSPRPSAEDREIFFTLLGYHYGRGTLSDEEFARRWAMVESASSLAQLYEANSDLTFPPPLADITDRSTAGHRRRRWFR